MDVNNGNNWFSNNTTDVCCVTTLLVDTIIYNILQRKTKKATKTGRTKRRLKQTEKQHKRNKDGFREKTREITKEKGRKEMISDKTLEILHKYICEQAIDICNIHGKPRTILERQAFKQRLNTCLKRGYRNAVLHKGDAGEITDKDILQEAKEVASKRITEMCAYRKQHPARNKSVQNAFNYFLLVYRFIFNAIEKTLCYISREIEDGKENKKK